jgi:hypothetical protein
MNITVINGSPKGKCSISYQSVRYLEKRVLDVSFFGPFRGHRGPHLRYGPPAPLRDTFFPGFDLCDERPDAGGPDETV